MGCILWPLVRFRRRIILAAPANGVQISNALTIPSIHAKALTSTVAVAVTLRRRL